MVPQSTTRHSNSIIADILNRPFNPTGIAAIGFSSVREQR